MSLWPNNTKIEAIGVTGEYGSGKSLFCLSIDPKQTLYYDFEKSGGSYEGMYHTRIDAPAEMLAKFPAGYKPVDVFTWWLLSVRTVSPGLFRVIVLDSIGDIEAGLVDYVKSQHKDYGFSSPEKFEAMGGVFWKYVRELWKTILVDLASRCETFAFTAHLRAVWRGGKPTSMKEPVGKQTLFELASLYLWLSREERGEGGVIKTLKAPWADVTKSRLARTQVLKDGSIEIEPILPPRLPVATPNAIREYIANPKDYSRLSKSEKKIVAELTGDERMRIESQTAEDNRAAAEAQLEFARLTQSNYQSVAMAAVEESTKATKGAEEPAPKSTDPQPSVAETGSVTRQQLVTLLDLVKASGIDDETYKKALARFEVKTARDLSQEEFAKLRAWLQAKVERIKNKDELHQWAEAALVGSTADADIPFETGLVS